jgi:Fe-S cluster assembly scaffold protein SufB
MSKDLELKVNVLPVTTYNFLHVNEGRLEIKNFDITDRGLSEPLEIPEGVSLKRGVSYQEAGRIFREFSDRILSLREEAVSPNGETASRDKDQAVRTGMGADIDGLMTEMGVGTDVYTIEEGAKPDKPIVLRCDMENGESALISNVIHAKKNSEVTVIMAYSSDKEAEGFLGVSTRLLAEDGATINLVKAQTLGDGFGHFDDIGGGCLAGGKVVLTQLELGGSRVYTGAYVTLSEKEAAFESNMGYLSRQDHSLDMNFVADQRGKKTDAAMHFKGVLMDTASKVLRGTLDFKTGSSGSVGDEQEDVLLLSPDVINRTMPIILCQEEDVEGRHGATIGQLGDDLLFYMQTRGIDEESAKRIMIKARLESVARNIPDPEIKQRVLYYIQCIV